MSLPDPIDAHDRLRGSVADLVLTLRLHAEDLAQAEPTDIKELEGKLSGLLDTVMEGSLAVASAADAYEQVPEEPAR